MTDIPKNKPSWLLNQSIRVDLDGTPENPSTLKNIFTSLDEFFSPETSQVVVDSIAQRREVFDTAYNIYQNIKSVKNNVVNGVNTSVGNFVNDLSLNGAKMYVPYPFRGNLNTARNNAINYLSGGDNSPSRNSATYIGGITVIISSSVFTQATVVLLAWLFTLFGKDNQVMDVINKTINRPLLSPISGIIQSDPQILDFIENSFNQERDKWNDLSGRLADQLENIYKTNISESSIGKVINSIQNPSGVAQTEIEALIKAFREGKNIFNEIPDNIKSGEIVPGATYMILDYQVLTYNGQNYTDGDLFKGIQGISTYTTVGNGYVIKKSEPAPASELGLNSQDLSQVIQDFNPYNKWIDILTVGNLFGGLNNGINQAKQLLSDLGQVVEDADNVVINGTRILDNATSAVENSALNAINFGQTLVNTIKLDFNALTFNILAVPPVQGGLNQFKLVHSEWMQGDVPGSPQIEDDSIICMFTLTLSGNVDLGMIELLNKVLGIFNIKMLN